MGGKPSMSVMGGDKWDDKISPTDPNKGRADKQTTINVDRQSDALTVKKNMHKRTTPEKP